MASLFEILLISIFKNFCILSVSGLFSMYIEKESIFCCSNFSSFSTSILKRSVRTTNKKNIFNRYTVLKHNNRKFDMTWGQIYTSAKQTSLSIKSEKSSILRKRLSKYWNWRGKNIWPLKNIWRTLEDVKSNFRQLLFSTPCWFFHSFLS